MPTQQSTEDAPNPVNFPALPARRHLTEIVPDISPLPLRGRTDWPFEPWRFVLVATALLLVMPCGVAAAAPGISGAELACAICLAMFVAAFAIPSKETR